ncbi:MAG: hypothetical protein WCA99_20435, partial [Candidatus Sulfotelmatobacter sp.]
GYLPSKGRWPDARLDAVHKKMLSELIQQGFELEERRENCQKVKFGSASGNAAVHIVSHLKLPK